MSEEGELQEDLRFSCILLSIFTFTFSNTHTVCTYNKLNDHVTKILEITSNI